VLAVLLLSLSLHVLLVLVFSEKKTQSSVSVLSGVI